MAENTGNLADVLTKTHLVIVRPKMDGDRPIYLDILLISNLFMSYHCCVPQ